MTALQNVLDKLSRLDRDEPYFWKLLIDAGEYVALQEYVMAEVARNKMTAIRTKAIPIMAFIAEWYKREYDGSNSPADLNLDSSDLALLWQSSGIDADRYVAFDGVSHRWLYSIFVLGGLAARYEMKRADEGRFLRKLCRLFHGEDIEISVNEQNALAFRKSISEEQSLFKYLKEIFNGSMPVAESDLTDGSLFAVFRDKIVNANIETLAKTDKFQLSMALCQIPDGDLARRIIEIKMRPEEVGAGCHSYIRFDRMLAWKFQNPDKVHNLKLALKFLLKGAVVREADFEKPLMQWNHTGWREAGMLCRADRIFYCKDVPCAPFDKVELVMLASTGEKSTVGTWTYPGYAELRLSDPRRLLWSSKKGDAKDSAVLFDDNWRPEPPVRHDKLVLIDADDSPSDYSLNWIKIDEPFVLTDGTCSTQVFRPSGGSVRLHLKQYPNLIAYNAENVFHMIDMDGNELDLPVIFYRDDILISSFSDEGERFFAPDLIEYQNSDASRYCQWNSDSEPDKGIVKLRITVGNRIFKETVMLLTPADAQCPVIRDLKARKLIYCSDGALKTWSDQVLNEGGLEKVSEDIEFSEGGATGHLPLLRPITFRQWIIDDRYAGDIDDVLNLPWILRNRVRIVSLTPDGACSYDCARLKRWEEADRNFMYLWTEGKSIPAASSDPDAPSWLRLILGDQPPRKVTDYIFWNMEHGSVPKEKFLNENFAEKGIGFKNPSSISSPEYPFPYVQTEDNPGWDDDDFWGDEPSENPASTNEDEFESASVLDTFLVACKYETYFFMFPQLTESRYLDQSNLNEALVNPLKEHDGGRITELHLKGLERLSLETYLKIDLNELRK